MRLELESRVDCTDEMFGPPVHKQEVEPTPPIGHGTQRG